MGELIKKTLYDNIHGAITLTRAESRVLTSAYFQRLKWIRQLGFSFYIFSGATHTRFAHALGVLYIMDKIYSHCNLLLHSYQFDLCFSFYPHRN